MPMYIGYCSTPARALQLRECHYTSMYYWSFEITSDETLFQPDLFNKTDLFCLSLSRARLAGIYEITSLENLQLVIEVDLEMTHQV